MNPSVLLIFVAMAAATYFTRYAMIATMARELPPLLGRWLRFVPAAVLAAIVAPAALAPEGRLTIDIRAWAVLIGVVVAWRTRSVLWTIVGGLAAFYLIRRLGG
jgi:branched-subunit amino acid transport protein